MRDKPKTGDAADFALMYLFSNPPGYYTDVVDGIEQYLRTGKLPKEVADIQKLARK
ncbi:MAG: hypothetical protein KGH57_02890 [Candidatus Micrarchaeota archaeon]|nr:hypothetical protein [Candidatus Micrarchaeota archaeon]